MPAVPFIDGILLPTPSNNRQRSPEPGLGQTSFEALLRESGLSPSSPEAPGPRPTGPDESTRRDDPTGASTDVGRQDNPSDTDTGQVNSEAPPQAPPEKTPPQTGEESRESAQEGDKDEGSQDALARGESIDPTEGDRKAEEAAAAKAAALKEKQSPGGADEQAAAATAAASALKLSRLGEEGISAPAAGKLAGLELPKPKGNLPDAPPSSPREEKRLALKGSRPPIDAQQSGDLALGDGSALPGAAEPLAAGDGEVARQKSPAVAAGKTHSGNEEMSLERAGKLAAAASSENGGEAPRSRENNPNEQGSESKLRIVDLRAEKQNSRGGQGGNAGQESGSRLLNGESLEVHGGDSRQAAGVSQGEFARQLEGGGEAGRANVAHRTVQQDQLHRFLKESGYDEIVRNARVLLREGGNGELRLNLSPKELGSVRVQLQLQDSHIAGRIIVENSTVREVFEQNLDQLQRAFQSQGLETGRLEVSVEERGSGQQGQRHRRGGNGARVFEEHTARLPEQFYEDTRVNLMA